MPKDTYDQDVNGRRSIEATVPSDPSHAAIHESGVILPLSSRDTVQAPRWYHAAVRMHVNDPSPICAIVRVVQPQPARFVIRKCVQLPESP